MAPSVECFAAPTLAHHDAVGGAIHTINGGQGLTLVIEAADPGLTLGDQPRLEAPVTIARHLDLEGVRVALEPMAR